MYRLRLSTIYRIGCFLPKSTEERLAGKFVGQWPCLAPVALTTAR